VFPEVVRTSLLTTNLRPALGLEFFLRSICNRKLAVYCSKWSCPTCFSQLWHFSVTPFYTSLIDKCSVQFIHEFFFPFSFPDLKSSPTSLLFTARFSLFECWICLLRWDQQLIEFHPFQFPSCPFYQFQNNDISLPLQWKINTKDKGI